jgi:mono/diheme cytochrome c family protein
VLLLALLLLPAVALAQSHRPGAAPPPPAYQYTANPFSGDPARAGEGRVIYNQTCVICHGPNGAGGRGPNLTASKLQGVGFLRVVLEGRKDTQMPAWKGKLSEEEVWKVMAYLGR